MSSSDDEDEALPHAVLNYHFVNANDEPASFSDLPVYWIDDNQIDESLNCVSDSRVFLRGTSDDGLQTIYKQVTAWRFDISFVNPEISVYLKDKKWIKLVKPKKSFEEVIRSVLVTIQCLNFLKHRPEATRKSLWDSLAKAFSHYDVRPSENDLVENMALITEATKRDESLRKSEVLDSFIKEKPKKRKDLDEVVAPMPFIVDDTDDAVDGIIEDESEEDEDYDTVCAFCDNGGDLLCCEGSCMRSFHPTRDSGIESHCETLCLTAEQVERMPTFFCPNCQLQKHQCFSCGKLGSSNKSAGAEVFRCVKATCGRFYHPICASKLIHGEDEAAAKQLEGEISNGKSFTCPVHRCYVCKMEENQKVEDLQFAVCRRCPKSYHRKCLPRMIGFVEDEENGILPRAWEGLLTNRILIYCMKHKIDKVLKTPMRSHINFDTFEDRRKKYISELRSRSGRDQVMSGKKSSNLENSTRLSADVKARSLVKPFNKADKVGFIPTKGNTTASESDLSKRAQGASLGKKLARGATIRVTQKVEKTLTSGGNKMSLGDQLFDFYSKSGLQEDTVADKSGALTVQVPELKLDADSEKRLKDIMKVAASGVTTETMLKKHKGPSTSTHSYFSRDTFDKTITQGKVDAAVEAVRSALEKLESGASVQEAKDICEPRVLTNVVKWKEKLKVYLAPFLHGMRYTSFGRHFTKVDKLEQIVDRLHWYVQNGDMIVDFCCGSNDFSCIMKRKLEETGKKCSFKNFDIIQAKNDFNFVQKDWFEVTASELVPGSQLIMGLNPPFGVKASLANKFIDKALEFKPKLFILIVPPETQRLDEKKTPYDLIWEDSELLSGKAFYLPGSVDENNKQLDDWNNTTPPLYLWSNRDYTNKAKAIAEKHGHISRNPSLFKGEESSPPQTSSPEPPMRIKEHEESASREAMTNQGVQKLSPQPATREAMTNQGLRKLSPHNNGGHQDDQKGSREMSPNGQCRGQSKVGRDVSLRKDSSDIYRRTLNGRGQKEEMNSNQDHRKTQTEEPRVGIASEQQNNGRSYKTNRQMQDSNHRLDRSSSERCQPPSDVRPTVDRYTSGYIRELSEQAPHSFQNDIPGSGPLGYGVMDTDITRDITSLYTYNDRMFSPGPDGFGDPYVNDLTNGRRETEMRSLIQNYGKPNPDPFINHENFMPNIGSSYNHYNPLPAAAYNNFGPAAADPSYNRLNTSAMERYAPHLDELNNPRVNNNAGFEMHPPLGARSGMYDPRAGQQPTQHGPRPGSDGFAYGSSNAFVPGSSSGGWIN